MVPLTVTLPLLGLYTPAMVLSKGGFARAVQAHKAVKKSPGMMSRLTSLRA